MFYPEYIICRAIFESCHGFIGVSKWIVDLAHGYMNYSVISSQHFVEEMFVFQSTFLVREKKLPFSSPVKHLVLVESFPLDSNVLLHRKRLEKGILFLSHDIAIHDVTNLNVFCFCLLDERTTFIHNWVPSTMQTNAISLTEINSAIFFPFLVVFLHFNSSSTFPINIVQMT